MQPASAELTQFANVSISDDLVACDVPIASSRGHMFVRAIGAFR
jgi:hypothetical protein